MAIVKKAEKAATAAAETKAADTKTSPAFEDMSGGDEGAAETVTAKAEIQAETVQAKTTAVATRASHAVTSPSKSIVSPLDDIKSAFHVDYDTLLQVQAIQGQFFDKAAEESMGETITIELMSFQQNFVISPGEDGEEASQNVRYSDDGVTTKDGMDCKEYIKQLQDAGYGKAKMSERSVLVGVLINPGKLAALEGQLCQIDLAPTSKKQFDRYKIQTAYDVSKGKYTAEEVKLLKLTCRVDTGNIGGKKTNWTVVQFARA